MTSENIFPERLQALIEGKKVRSAEISRETGVSAGNISHYLSGKRKPKGKNLFALANFFNVDPDWLLTGKGNRLDASLDKGYDPDIEKYIEEGSMSSSQKDELLAYKTAEIKSLRAEVAQLEGQLAEKMKSQGRRKKTA